MPNSIPGDIYLCQVSDFVSCGACCGLYNIPELSQSRLHSLLQSRTERLAQTPRTEKALDDFAIQELRALGDSRPYPHFHHCPFLGLIGSGQERVGCLLHPLVPENKHIDFRGLSYYGAAACALYFCPAYFQMSGRYKRILQVTSPDWYIYGLMITEHRLVKALLGEVEARIGRKLTEFDFLNTQRSYDLIQPLLFLKETWPYRMAQSHGPCHYVFEDGNYPRQANICSSETGQRIRYASLLKELESSFDSPALLLQAQSELDALFAVLARSIVES
jgi:hypothetical protein